MKRAALILLSTLGLLVSLLRYETPALPVSRVSALPSTGTTTTTPATAAAGATTTTGDSIDTRWGPVQVAVVTDAKGAITAVTVLDHPSSNSRDREINSRALPILQQETMAAQSAQIDTVSGATYTSEGYQASLQSALDKL